MMDHLSSSAQPEAELKGNALTNAGAKYFALALPEVHGASFHRAKRSTKSCAEQGTLLTTPGMAVFSFLRHL